MEHKNKHKNILLSGYKIRDFFIASEMLYNFSPYIEMLNYIILPRPQNKA